MDVCCAAGAPVAVDYTPKGSVQELGGVPCYVTGQTSSAAALICIYDIFGPTAQFKQVCDRLAAAGYLVAGPDVFRGQPWSMDKFPPKPEDNFMGWIQSHSYDVSTGYCLALGRQKCHPGTYVSSLTRVYETAGVLERLSGALFGAVAATGQCSIIPPPLINTCLTHTLTHPVLLQGVVSKDVDAVVAALKAQGVTKFASVGWCWGAAMAVQAAAAHADSFKATGFLHPSLFGQEKQLVAKLQCPLATFSTPGGMCVVLCGCQG